MRPATTLALVLLLVSLPAASQGADLELERGRTTIRFELDSTLHRVTGVARLEEGVLHFDPSGGVATGRIGIDAQSLDSGNWLRDRQMHRKVLESERFPRIEFLPSALVVGERGTDTAKIVLTGVLRMHGGEWPLRIPASVDVEGDGFRIEGSFRIPYVEWGMADMSNPLLSVDPEVLVHFESFGRVSPRLAAAQEEGLE